MKLSEFSINRSSSLAPTSLGLRGTPSPASVMFCRAARGPKGGRASEETELRKRAAARFLDKLRIQDPDFKSPVWTMTWSCGRSPLPYSGLFTARRVVQASAGVNEKGPQRAPKASVFAKAGYLRKDPSPFRSPRRYPPGGKPGQSRFQASG